MSMSAPSAINTDFSTVKFDDEATEWHNAEPSQAKSAMSHRSEKKCIQTVWSHSEI